MRHRHIFRGVFFEPFTGLESSPTSGYQGTVAMPRDLAPSTASAVTSSDYVTAMNEDLLLAIRLQEAENEHAQSRNLSSSNTSLWRPRTAPSLSDAKTMQQKAFDQVSQNKKSGGKGPRDKCDENDGEIKASKPSRDKSSCRIS